jgi:hypothetical protein
LERKEETIMPNWCHESLSISGKPPEVQRFKEFAQIGDNVIDEEQFIPYPKEYREADIRYYGSYGKCKPIITNLPGAPAVTDGFNNGGEEWCCDNWGSKWGICEPERVDLSPQHIMYYFESAWSPVTPLVCKMSEIFPKLLFCLTYTSFESEYYGYVSYKRGQVKVKRYSNFFPKQRVKEVGNNDGGLIEVRNL